MLLVSAAILALSAIVEGRQCNSSSSRQLWYETPGSDFETGLAIGNGRLGALVLGSAAERVILNENSVWSGAFEDRINPNALETFPRIRELLMNGNITQAGESFLANMTGIPTTSRMYSVTNDLVIDFGHSENEWSNYKRWLDPMHGNAGVSYEYEAVEYT